MKSASILFSSLLALLVMTGCELEEIKGSGHIVADEREVPEFTKIAFEGTGNLIIKQGFKSSLTIQTDDNLLKYIESKVVDGTLVLSIKEGNDQKNLRPKEGIFYYATLKDLDSLELSGVGNVRTVAQFLGDSLKVKLSGSGNLFLDISMESFELFLSGAGKVRMKGEVKEEYIRISGAGVFEGGDLKAETAKFDISGSGSVVVDALKSLDIKIYGTGNVQYKGNPKLTQAITGTGTIKKIE